MGHNEHIIEFPLTLEKISELLKGNTLMIKGNLGIFEKCLTGLSAPLDIVVKILPPHDKILIDQEEYYRLKQIEWREVR